MSPEHLKLVEVIAQVWCAHPFPFPVICLGGTDPLGSEDIAAAVAARSGFGLHAIGADDVPHGTGEIDRFLTLWQREAALLPSALLVRCNDSAVPGCVAALAEQSYPPLVIMAREPLRLRRPVLNYEVAKPDASEQKRLWRLALGPAEQHINGALEGVSSQFRFSTRTILTAGSNVNQRIAAGEPAEDALWTTCRDTCRQRIDDLAQRIPPTASWNDLVLPDPQIGALRQIVAQVRQRGRVYDEWGFGGRNARGLGITALFSGGSGTGKTLSAEVLASELELDLYRIDLSLVISKYIGETEKNLRRVFDVAEESGAVLLFDEADALFGKRSDVKDSHDRYANIEVGYLLQRMELYRGLAILTTNLKSALDPAFQRRLRFVVHFPFPDASQREAIWRITLPKTAPASGLDFGRLSQLNVSGGGVRNIALNAAFLAADADEPITMHHLLAAAQAESAKLERPLSHAELRGWT
jgi:hypothetical protein